MRQVKIARQQLRLATARLPSSILRFLPYYLQTNNGVFFKPYLDSKVCQYKYND